MSLKDLLSLAPAPGLDLALTLLTSTYENIENIKVYKQQCRDLSNRCVKLVLALREGMHGQESSDWASELEDVLLAIDKKVKEWGAMGRLKSFLQQSDIEHSLEAFQRDVDGAMMKYHISASLELRRGFNESRAIQERDKAEIREVLQTIVQSNTDMKALLNMTSSRPVEEIMEHLQVELMDPTIPETQERSFREGLWYLHSRTSKLPPLTELTGQVTKESDHTAFIGTYNDVFRGRWLDREKVALRLPRNLPNRANIQRRFEREVAVWRQLDHPNVLPLYGIAKIGEHVYSVSPWMDNGTAISYVQEYPQINRLRLLSEIASGLEYLHFQDIVHGDLRGANVLISEDGVARLADFGLSKFLGDCGQGMTSAPNINPRWFAPELIRQTGTFSKQSDIWSLSMTFLEILTGEQPFADLSLDIHVLRHIDQGKTPTRPMAQEYVDNGLNDSMWSLIKKCWKPKPESRPTIQEIRTRLAEVRGEGGPRQTTQPKLTKSLSFSFSGPRSTRSNPDHPSTSSGSSMSSSSRAVSTRPHLIIPVGSGSGDKLPRRPSTGGSSTSATSSASGRFKHVIHFPSDHTIEEDPISPSDRVQSPASSSSGLSPSIPYTRGQNKSSDGRQHSSGFLVEPAGRPIPSRNGTDAGLRPEYQRNRDQLLDPPSVSSSPSSFPNGSPISRRESEPSTGASFSSRYGTSPISPRRDPLTSRPTYSSGTSNLSTPGETNLRREYQRAPQLPEVPLVSSSPPFHNFPFSTSPPTESIDSRVVTKPKPVRSLFSTTDTSGSSGPLQDAILDPEFVLYTDGGEVIAGTLEGLIERLIVNFNLRKDEEYRDVMLTSCIDFITPEDLFAVLARRFNEAEKASDGEGDRRGPETRVGVQYTIFRVLLHWLSKRHLPVNSTLLWQMKAFCQAAIQLKTSETMVDKGNDLLYLIDLRTKGQLIEESLTSPFNTQPERKRLEASQISPKDLAIALTLLEGDKYEKIMPCDYLAHQRRQPINGYKNHVDIACVVNNRIIQWVKESILHYDDVVYRSDVIKFYINTAQQCRKMRNFSSFVAIAIALNSAPVERLRLTKNLLSPKMKGLLDEIVSMLHPTENHSAYRTALKEIPDPEYKDYCIPWLALHLKQLHSVLVENPRVVEIERRHLINFKRYVEYVKLFKEVLHFRPPLRILEKYRDQGQLAYLEHQLSNVHTSDSADDDLMARSMTLEAGEAILFEHRILERKSLGFATPKKFRSAAK